MIHPTDVQAATAKRVKRTHRTDFNLAIHGHGLVLNGVKAQHG